MPNKLSYTNTDVFSIRIVLFASLEIGSANWKEKTKKKTILTTQMLNNAGEWINKYEKSELKKEIYLYFLSWEKVLLLSYPNEI